MSSRQLRRLRPQNILEQFDPQSDDSDEFAPGYAKVREPEANSFKVLKQQKKGKKVKNARPKSSSDEDCSIKQFSFDDDSGSEFDLTSWSRKNFSSDTETSTEADGKNHKKSFRKKKSKDTRFQVDNDFDVDEAVAEVNRLLGTPPPQPAMLSSASEVDMTLRVDYKCLDPRSELMLLIGPDEGEENKSRRRPEPSSFKRIIRTLDDKFKVSFKGLSMQKIEEIDGIKYYKYTHSVKYVAKIHRLIEVVRFLGWTPPIRQQFSFDTLEGLIQNLDLFFNEDEPGMAARTMDGAVLYVQSIFAPGFSYFDGKTRLEYKHVENRPFFILLLKYIHLLTNKACHRTALEIAKLLLNLDPSDPLALIFIIDIIALRAYRHEWLLDLFKKWERERHAGRLFNMLYSRALAKYNIYLKSKKTDDLEEANFYLKHSIVLYPNVGIILLDNCKRNVTSLEEHPMIALAKSKTPGVLAQLQSFHSHLVWPKWREAEGALTWLTDTIKLVLHEYDTIPMVKEQVEEASTNNSALFRTHPVQIKRHLSIIDSMSELISDGHVPRLEHTICFNPFPYEKGNVDVHGYYSHSTAEILEESYLRTFLSSLIDDH